MEPTAIQILWTSGQQGRFKDGASQYFLGYQAEGGAIQGDGEYLKKSKFQQQKVGQMIKKAVQSEILEVPLENIGRIYRNCQVFIIVREGHINNYYANYSQFHKNKVFPHQILFP